MNCLAEARDQVMEKLHSLKSSTKERLSENEEELQALKDTNDKLKEMVNTMEVEKETWKRNIEELGAQKQVAWSAGTRPISSDFRFIYRLFAYCKRGNLNIHIWACFGYFIC